VKVKITEEKFKITDKKFYATDDSRMVVSLTIKKNISHITKFVRN
jgi:hypothetical protein